MLQEDAALKQEQKELEQTLEDILQIVHLYEVQGANSSTLIDLIEINLEKLKERKDKLLKLLTSPPSPNLLKEYQQNSELFMLLPRKGKAWLKSFWHWQLSKKSNRFSTLPLNMYKLSGYQSKHKPSADHISLDVIKSKIFKDLEKNGITRRMRNNFF